mmetsp:Transcript_19512/g.47112  ORF Transcript_19512/g.47112 Transcript_19512/m.47112 type:complete len:202 (-) Transcript_19512:814-1419(-)
MAQSNQRRNTPGGSVRESTGAYPPPGGRGAGTLLPDEKCLAGPVAGTILGATAADTCRDGTENCQPGRVCTADPRGNDSSARMDSCCGRCVGEVAWTVSGEESRDGAVHGSTGKSLAGCISGTRGDCAKDLLNLLSSLCNTMLVSCRLLVRSSYLRWTTANCSCNSWNPCCTSRTWLCSSATSCSACLASASLLSAVAKAC